jgi:hypothetical protein
MGLIMPFHRQFFPLFIDISFFPFFLSTKNIMESEIYWRNSALGKERNKVNTDDSIQHFSKRMLSSIQRREKVTKAVLISGRDFS